MYTRYKHFWLHFTVLKTMNVCVQSTVCQKIVCFLLPSGRLHVQNGICARET